MKSDKYTIAFIIMKLKQGNMNWIISNQISCRFSLVSILVFVLLVLVFVFLEEIDSIVFY